jgi:hypothetical protein
MFNKVSATISKFFPQIEKSYYKPHNKKYQNKLTQHNVA